MGILDNFENWVNLEPITNEIKKEEFWQDIGRPENDGLALKIFQDQCCNNCSCR